MLSVRGTLPVIVPLNVSAPVPVCWTLASPGPTNVTAAGKVAAPPWVVLLPWIEIDPAVIDKTPGVPVGPMVTPAIEKFCAAEKV